MGGGARRARRAHTRRYVPTRTTRLRRSCRRIPLGRSHFRCRRRSASGDIPSGYATRSCALPDSENDFRQMQRYLGNALLGHTVQFLEGLDVTQVSLPASRRYVYRFFPAGFQRQRLHAAA